MPVTAVLPDAPWLEEVFLTRLPQPDIRAVIRQSPADFRVTETLSNKPVGSGEHVYLDVTKTGANTAWVADRIAEFAGVRPLDVGYAGRKDRHAMTRQWFSVYLPKSEPAWSSLTIEGVDLHQAVRHATKLRRGEIECNRFDITVRHEHLEPRQVQDVEHRLVSIRDSGFPNYFGPQRFGRYLHNLESADKLLRFKRKARGDRGMLLSAARAWLFNLYLSRQVGTADEHETGPLYGKSRDAQAGEEALSDVYAGWVAGLRRLGSKVGERKLMTMPRNMQWTQADEHLQIAFDLPAGSYATSLLSEVFVVEDGAL